MLANEVYGEKSFRSTAQETGSGKRTSEFFVLHNWEEKKPSWSFFIPVSGTFWQNDREQDDWLVRFGSIVALLLLHRDFFITPASQFQSFPTLFHLIKMFCVIILDQPSTTLFIDSTTDCSIVTPPHFFSSKLFMRDLLLFSIKFEQHSYSWSIFETHSSLSSLI